MLAHVTQLQADHKVLAKEIQAIYAKAGYEAGKGLTRLEKLFEDDFRVVHGHRGEDFPFPDDFEALTPFVAECLQRLGEPSQAVRIVNTEHKLETPDFDRERVWKILVGGAKLSRGYTVEGLTVTYYRRRAGASDTLMQMGRWFGFRRGYKDLVRLFIGTDEIDGGPSSKKRINLYEAFGAICRDEEMFRGDLVRYAEDPNVVPATVPPLVPAHMLRPTAANKMRNARITFRNYGGELSESTFAPKDAKAKKENIEALKALVEGAEAKPLSATGRHKGVVKSFDGTTFETSPERMIEFLERYTWYDAKSPDARYGNPLRLQLEFLKGSAGDPGIERWLVISPEISKPQGAFKLGGADLNVVVRTRQSPTRFNTYNDPTHRAFARHLAGPDLLVDPSEDLEAFRKPRTGVMILYPIVEEKGKGERAGVTVGFTLLYPKNGIRSAVGFTTYIKGPELDAVVDVEDVKKVVEQEAS